MKADYAKLDSGIVYSSMWGEDAVTCKVWITLLALKDLDGVVTQNVTGIARISNLPLKDVQATIEKFLLPDPCSTTKTDEGRRLRKIEGIGFEVVNHDLYQQLGWSDEKKEFERKRKAEYRARRSGRLVTAKPGTPTPGLVEPARPDVAVVEEPVEMSVMVRFQALRKRLEAYWTRPPDAPWDYLEEHKLLEIAKRPSCKEELDIILAHYKSLPGDKKQYYPMASVIKLLEGWTKLLDTARMASGVNPGDPDAKARGDALWEKMAPAFAKGIGDQFRVNP